MQRWIHIVVRFSNRTWLELGDGDALKLHYASMLIHMSLHMLWQVLGKNYPLTLATRSLLESEGSRAHFGAIAGEWTCDTSQLLDAYIKLFHYTYLHLD